MWARYRPPTAFVETLRDVLLTGLVQLSWVFGLYSYHLFLHDASLAWGPSADMAQHILLNQVIVNFIIAFLHLTEDFSKKVKISQRRYWRLITILVPIPLCWDLLVWAVMAQLDLGLALAGGLPVLAWT